MESRMIPGATVALTSCPAETHTAEPVRVSGLWVIEDFEPADRAAFVHEPCFHLYREDRAPFAVIVTAYDLREQVNPAAHARELAMERAFDFYAEDRCF